MPFAFFDLDQTLLPWDTQVLFCNHVLRRHGRRRGYLALMAGAAPLRALGILGNGGMKRAFLSFLWRMPRARLEELSAEFAEEVVPPLLYPEVMDEVELHRAAGRTLVLNTASPEFYATAIARVLRFDHCFGTRIVFPDDPLPLIPQLEGANNKHGEKLLRMRHLIPADATLPLPGSYAYSDSRADLPLLRHAASPVAVNPDRHLESVALAEQWRIMRPARPQRSKRDFVRDCALQAAGLWKPNTSP